MLEPISSPYCEAILRLVKVDQVLNSKSFIEWDGDEYEDTLNAYNSAVQEVERCLDYIIDRKFFEHKQSDALNNEYRD